MRHDHTPGVSAYVNVGGVRLEEYEEDEDVDQHGTTNTTRYVEATPGATFSASVAFDNKSFPYVKDDIQCSMELDGKHIISYIRLVKHNHAVVPFDGRTEVTPSGTYLRRFKFQDLATNDGAVREGIKETLKNLGTISLKLTRVQATTVSATKHSTDYKEIGGESVPEKGLKGRAISTQAALGAREKVRDSTFQDVSFKYGTRPFAEFTFKYRSHKDLQIEGIIPRSPSPVPLEQRDPATLDANELRQLLERRNEELKTLSKIKKEKRERSTTMVGEDDDDDQVIETERRSKRHRTSQDSGIDVVDLTED
ncbi:hypothetical protein PRZ48_006496 [Zasmidium cellare]|uniref:DUF7918 domain-containing protein n=1 Tax=Zasmidium cellare TaxID=395010 RepID=A0ABR0ENW9_ZASCE|nr:hypothetical protein PRZ48_006496 [Zasmidium cellare]